MMCPQRQLHHMSSVAHLCGTAIDAKQHMALPHEQICEPEPLSLLVPPEAEPFLVPESATCNRPFSLKHAQQQVHVYVCTCVCVCNVQACWHSCARTHSAVAQVCAGPCKVGPAGRPWSLTPHLHLRPRACPGFHSRQHEAARSAGGCGADHLH